MALSSLFCAGVPLSSYSFTAGWDRSGTGARASPIFLRFVWGRGSGFMTSVFGWWIFPHLRLIVMVDIWPLRG